jgi:TPR repeat protein
MADYGEGGPRDWRAAGAFYKASAKLGSNFGERNYADWLVDHPSLGGGRYSSPRVDVAQVLDLYRRSAAQNDTVAMMKLAACYKRGNPLGLPESAKSYADWTRQAALAGDADAMVSMGWACEHGYGVPKDGTQTLFWAEKAAEAGHLQAMTNLGILYSQGRVVPKDPVKSIAWFKRGDAGGSWTATYELAIRYREGDGVPRDPSEAARLFRKAAGYGWGQAWLGLGHLYEDGYGVPKDPAQALDCYFMGARRWDAVSENNIGAFYEHGIAGTTDLALAWCWFRIAKDEGCQLAARNLESLEGRMGFLDKLRAAKRLPSVRGWLVEARAEEKKRLEQMSGMHS